MQQYWHKGRCEWSFFYLFFFTLEAARGRRVVATKEDSDNEKPEMRLIELIFLPRSDPSNTKDTVGSTVAGLFVADLHSLQMDRLCLSTRLLFCLKIMLMCVRGLSGGGHRTEQKPGLPLPFHIF